MSYGKIWIGKEHNTSKCEEPSKDLPFLVPLEIIDLALTVLSQKKARKSELMKLILDVQEKTDQKVKELMEEERKQIQQHATVEKF